MVAIVLVTGVVAPVAFAQADGGDGGAADRQLTLEELSPGGTKPANAPASIRANGKYGEFAVKTLPTGLLVDESERSASWRYMESGQTVRRNYLQIWSKRSYGAERQNYTVEVAHYQVDQIQEETEDGTTRNRKVAQNVTTYERSITFGGGYDIERIDLQEHYEERVRTVMCIRQPDERSCLENPGDARWTFHHSSSKATLPIETNSAGARLGWGMVSLLLPFFAGSVITLYGGRKAVERAKAGPQISAIWWVMAAVGGILFVVVAWDWVSGTLIRAPWLVSAAGGILLGVIAVEWFGRRTYGAAFLQFRMGEGFDPSDPAEVQEAAESVQGGETGEGDSGGGPEDAPGKLKAHMHISRFAQGDTNARSAIRKGLRKFWARARGASADLEVEGNMQTKIDVEGPVEEMYLLDPEQDQPLEYQPEHHRIQWPDLVTYEETEDGETVRKFHPVPWIAGGLGLGLSWLLGTVLTGSGALGLLVGAVAIFATKIARPKDGYLRADLAPLHYHHAVASMLTHARGLADAKSWDEWFTNYAESEAESHADRQELLDDRSESQMDQIFQRYVGEGGAEDAPVRGRGSEIVDRDQEEPADD